MRDEITKCGDGSPSANDLRECKMQGVDGSYCPLPRVSARNRTPLPWRDSMGRCADANARKAIRCRMAFHLCLFEFRLVAVVVCLIGAFHRNADVVGLLLRELRELHADLFKVQAGYFFVQLLGQGVDADLV